MGSRRGPLLQVAAHDESGRVGDLSRKEERVDDVRVPMEADHHRLVGSEEAVKAGGVEGVRVLARGRQDEDVDHVDDPDPELGLVSKDL